MGSCSCSESFVRSVHQEGALRRASVRERRDAAVSPSQPSSLSAFFRGEQARRNNTNNNKPSKYSALTFGAQDVGLMADSEGLDGGEDAAGDNGLLMGRRTPVNAIPQPQPHETGSLPVGAAAGGQQQQQQQQRPRPERILLEDSVGNSTGAGALVTTSEMTHNRHPPLPNQPSRSRSPSPLRLDHHHHHRGSSPLSQSGKTGGSSDSSGGAHSSRRRQHMTLEKLDKGRTPPSGGEHGRRLVAGVVQRGRRDGAGSFASSGSHHSRLSSGRGGGWSAPSSPLHKRMAIGVNRRHPSGGSSVVGGQSTATSAAGGLHHQPQLHRRENSCVYPGSTDAEVVNCSFPEQQQHHYHHSRGSGTVSTPASPGRLRQQLQQDEEGGQQLGDNLLVRSLARQLEALDKQMGTDGDQSSMMSSGTGKSSGGISFADSNKAITFGRFDSPEQLRLRGTESLPEMKPPSSSRVLLPAILRCGSAGSGKRSQQGESNGSSSSNNNKPFAATAASAAASSSSSSPSRSSHQAAGGSCAVSPHRGGSIISGDVWGGESSSRRPAEEGEEEEGGEKGGRRSCYDRSMRPNTPRYSSGGASSSNAAPVPRASPYRRS